MLDVSCKRSANIISPNRHILNVEAHRFNVLYLYTKIVYMNSILFSMFLKVNTGTVLFSLTIYIC